MTYFGSMNRQEGCQIETASFPGVCFHSEIKKVPVYTER